MCIYKAVFKEHACSCTEIFWTAVSRNIWLRKHLLKWVTEWIASRCFPTRSIRAVMKAVKHSSQLCIGLLDVLGCYIMLMCKKEKKKLGCCSWTRWTFECFMVEFEYIGGGYLRWALSKCSFTCGSLLKSFAEWCFLTFLARADVMLRDRKLIKLVNQHISQRQRVNQIINSARLPARHGSL